MAITDKQLISELKSGHFAPIYLLTGEDNYTIDVVSNYFEEHIVPEENRDFDQTIVYGRDVDMATVVSLAKRYPMMSERQLVMVKEAQGMETKDDAWNCLIEYLKHPQTNTVLVLCYRHKKIDKRTAAYKAINSAGVVLETAKMYDDKVPFWIAEFVQEHGYTITEKCAVLIAEFIGNDRGKIANELSKVFISLPQGTTINDDVVERNIGISKDYNIFELQNAIGRRDVERCNRIVNHFAANPKENPIQLVLPILYGYFIKVMTYIQLEDKTQAAKALGVNPFFVKDYARAAGNYTLPKLASCIGYLHDADLSSKGLNRAATTTDGEIFKELIFKILH